MKIPFSFLPIAPDPAFPDRTQRKRPIVALLLSKGECSDIVFAVVDSGADICVFPASVAQDLRIHIPNENSSEFTGSHNETQIAYFEQIRVTLLPMDAPNIDPDQEMITFPLYAGFCATMEHIGMGLLGQEGFFSQFAVTFHQTQNYFEIL